MSTAQDRRDLHGKAAQDGRARRGPYPLEEPELSLGDVVGRLTGEVGDLLNAHVQLAKLELIEDAKRAGKGAGMLGGGAVAGWIAMLLLSMAAAFGLALVMDIWLAFLIVGALWAVVAAVLVNQGKQRLEDMDPGPELTMKELEKDKEWMKRQP